MRSGATQSGAAARAPRVVAIMLTRRCDIACGHCSVVSGPDVRGEPAEQDLLDAVRAAAAAGATSIQLTGGEPMLRESVVLAMLREGSRLGLDGAMTTNGSWAATPEDARRRLRALLDAGLELLTVSYDRWHEEQLGSAAVLNVVRAANEMSFPVHVNVVRGADDHEVGRLADLLATFANVRLRFYDAQPVGRAKAFATESLRGETSGFCRAAWFPALTDDGRLTSCNGPAYFAKPGSPLVLGTTRETPLGELLARHGDDPIVQTIRAYGPERLRSELARLPGFASFPFRARYGGMCELCLHVTSQPDAVAALRARLAEPRLAAERVAALRLISEARSDGLLSSAHANGLGAARIFFAAARDGAYRLPADADRVLGRADLDWKRRADYLVSCGLARPLARLADEPALARWAPSFFRDELRRAATRSAMIDLIKSSALELIDQSLVTVGARGVLLKGTALLATASAAQRGHLRSTGDIDLLVTAGRAGELRRLLLARGCDGDESARRSAAHHLAAVSFRGVAIEIHERILPKSFGLPEDELLGRVQAVPGMKALDVLDAEGFVLHTLLHCTAHVFAFGLKTAFDVAWMLDERPDLDWQRVAAWARSCRLPRGFWTPLRALVSGLELAVPPWLLDGVPRDRRQHALDTIAHVRIFAAHEGPFELNPFSKTAVFLLLADSWRGRLRYAGELAHGEAAAARRSARRHVPAQALRRMPQQLREVAFQWRAFRAASARL